VLVEAAHRLDPGRLRRVVGHLQLVAEPSTSTTGPSGVMGGGWWSASTWRHGRRGRAAGARGRPDPAGRPGPPGPGGCRRLACDGVLTRVLVTRHPPPATTGRTRAAPGDHDAHGGGGDGGLAARLQTAAALPPRSWAGLPASPWMSGGPAGSSSPANAPPWPGPTGAVASPAVTGPWPGATPIICSTGWTAAPPTWPCCAGPSIGRSTRAAGN
jgi:hypothetical protein